MCVCECVSVRESERDVYLQCMMTDLYVSVCMCACVWVCVCVYVCVCEYVCVCVIMSHI